MRGHLKRSGMLWLALWPTLAGCAAVAGLAAPRPSPVPPTPLPSAVPPEGPPEVWALPFEYRFPVGFWSPGRHSYRMRIRCQELGYTDAMSGLRHFSVFEDTPGESRPPIFLRQLGLSTKQLGLPNRAYIHQEQQTTALVVLLGLGKEQAERLASSADCSVMIIWDKGIGMHNLSAGEPYLP